MSPREPKREAASAVERVGRDTQQRWLVRDVPADAASLTAALNECEAAGWSLASEEWMEEAEPPLRAGTLRLWFTATLPKPRKPWR